MKIFDFVYDGGLFGKMRGFDSSNEGHAYGFKEWKEDLPDALSCFYKVQGLVAGNMRKTLFNLLSSKDIKGDRG